MTAKPRIAVIGAGLMGHGIAQVFALAGHDVTIFERFAEPRPLGAGLLLQPTGLAVLRAPAAVWRALALAPVLGVWKLALLVRLWAGRGPAGWQRTEREVSPGPAVPSAAAGPGGRAPAAPARHAASA